MEVSDPATRTCPDRGAFGRANVSIESNELTQVIFKPYYLSFGPWQFEGQVGQYPPLFNLPLMLVLHHHAHVYSTHCSILGEMQTNECNKNTSASSNNSIAER